MYNIQKRSVNSMCYLLLRFIMLFDRLNVPDMFHKRLTDTQSFLMDLEDEIEEFARTLEGMLKKNTPYRQFVKQAIYQELAEGSFLDQGKEVFLDTLKEVLLERWAVDRSVYEFFEDLVNGVDCAEDKAS